MRTSPFDKLKMRTTLEITGAGVLRSTAVHTLPFPRITPPDSAKAWESRLIRQKTTISRP